MTGCKNCQKLWNFVGAARPGCLADWFRTHITGYTGPLPIFVSFSTTSLAVTSVLGQNSSYVCKSIYTYITYKGNYIYYNPGSFDQPQLTKMLKGSHIFLILKSYMPRQLQSVLDIPVSLSVLP